MEKQFSPEATAPAASATPAPTPVLTSEKLTALKAEFATAWAKMLTMTDPFSKETKDAKLAVWKIEGEIKAEEQAIIKAQNEAKIAEQRNARLAMNQAQLDAQIHLIAVRADKKSKAEDIAAAETAFNTAKEAVDNELLAKYAHSTSAKKSVTTGEQPTDSEAGKNTAAIVEMYLAGKTHKEIEEAGYARSTVWHAINNYKKANQVA